MTVAAIIQARMKSTRLPGKVLMPVAGRAVLSHVVSRLRRAKSIDAIAITTSTEPEDDALVAFAARERIPVFRGPEDNVLERYAIAARALKPAHIVRVTGDSPLIDPEFVDHLVGEMQRTGADFLRLEDGIKCIQEGVDPFSARALRVLLGEAHDDPVAREHVTGWLKEHPERVRTQTITIDPAHVFSGARLSIDTPADLEFFAALAERCDLDNVSLKEVVKLLKREPWLLAINAHVRQKKASQIAATVLIRADGGGALGYGHLTRTLALAEALRDREGVGVLALTGANPLGNAREARNFFEASKIPVSVKRPQQSEADFIREAADRARASALILDVRTELPRAALESLRSGGLKIVVIDDASARRLAADVAVYPPVPQARSLGWQGFSGERLVGPEWVLLSPSVAKCALSGDARGDRLLVAMGGSDPLQLSEPIASALVGALDAPIDVVLGPGVADAPSIARRLRPFKNVSVHHAPADPAAIYVRARLAVAAFGVTAYELAALGVPACYVTLSADHRRSAQGAEALGFGVIAAGAKKLNAHSLAGDVAALWNDGAKLADMSRAGRAAIDGRGAERLAAHIAHLIRSASQFPATERAPQRRPRPNRRLAAGE